jgi:hypothetical protein
MARWATIGAGNWPPSAAAPPTGSWAGAIFRPGWDLVEPNSRSFVSVTLAPLIRRYRYHIVSREPQHDRVYLFR